MKNIKNKVAVLLSLASLSLSTSLFSQNALAAGESAQGSMIAGVSVIASPFVSLAGVAVATSAIAAIGSEFIVTNVVAKSADIAEYTVKSSVNGSQYLMQISKSVATSSAIAVGTSIKVVVHSTGHLLVASGKVIAFIPNTVGKALLESTAVPAGNK